MKIMFSFALFYPNPTPYTSSHEYDKLPALETMRRPVIDNVKIVEPPLEELTKKSSGLKGACLMGCFFLIVLFIGIIVFIRLYSGPGPKTYTRVPEYFPQDIPVYDPDNIEKVTFISGKYKSRNIELAALAPKIMLSPLLIALNKDSTGMDATTTRFESFKNIFSIIMTPVGDRRDTLQVEWRNMDADMNFVFSYYKSELLKKNFFIDSENDTAIKKQFTFSRNDGMGGSMLIQGDELNRPGTDYALLTINFIPTITNPISPEATIVAPTPLQP